MALLRSVADPRTITLACDDTEYGWQDKGALYIHSPLVERLPPVLRVYVGCAELLFGSISEADIVKIHKASGKVTLLQYDRFDDAPLPRLLTRTKVNLRSVSTESHDHSRDNQLLYFKHRFLAPEEPQTDPLAMLYVMLEELGAPRDTFLGPVLSELMRRATEKGLDLRPFLEETAR